MTREELYKKHNKEYKPYISRKERMKEAGISKEGRTERMYAGLTQRKEEQRIADYGISLLKHYTEKEKALEPWSIMKETLKPSNLSEAGGKVGLFAIQVLQEIARSGGNVGLTIMAKGMEKLGHRLTQMTPEQAEKEANMIRRIPLINNPWARVIFGDRPLRAIETRVADAEIKAQKFAREQEWETIERLMTPKEGQFLETKYTPGIPGVEKTTLMTPLMGGFILLDFMGLGGKTAGIKLLAKTSKLIATSKKAGDLAKVAKAEVKIGKYLTKIGIADNIVLPVKRLITQTDDVSEISKIINRIEELQKQARKGLKSTKLSEAKALNVLKTEFPKGSKISKEIGKLESVAKTTPPIIRAVPKTKIGKAISEITTKLKAPAPTIREAFNILGGVKPIVKTTQKEVTKITKAVITKVSKPIVAKNVLGITTNEAEKLKRTINISDLRLYGKNLMDVVKTQGLKPTTSEGKRILNKITQQQYNVIVALAQSSKNIKTRQNMRAFLQALSDKTFDGYKIQKLIKLRNILNSKEDIASKILKKAIEDIVKVKKVVKEIKPKVITKGVSELPKGKKAEKEWVKKKILKEDVETKVKADLTEQKAIKKFKSNKLLERIFPYLRRKGIMKEYYKNITVQEEKDITGFGALIRGYLLPARAMGSKSPVAQMVTKTGRDVQLTYELEREAIEKLLDNIYSYQKLSRLQELKRAVLKQGATETELEFVKWLESGLPLNKIPIKHRRAIMMQRRLNEKALQIIEKEFKIDTSKFRFTPENYFHHLFVGEYQIKIGKNLDKTLGFAKNLNEAYDKAAIYLKLHPDDNIKIMAKDVFQDQYTATMLGRKEFFRLVNNVKKNTELSKKEILNVMRGVARIKTKSKFVGALLPRKANLGGYEKSPKFVQMIYWNRLLKKRYFEPWSKTMIDRIATLSPNLKESMEAYIRDVGGHYRNYGSWIPIVTRIQSTLKLGWRPSSAIVNRMQPLTTTYPELGEKYFGKALKYKRSEKGKKLIEESGILRQPPKYYAGEVLKGGGEAKWHPLYLFSKAELANRGDTYIGGYFYAMDKLNLHTINKALKNSGLPIFVDKETLAKSFGRDLVASTQFIYDVTDLPRIMRNPLGRLIFQFKPFTVNYLYNTTRVLRGKPLAGMEAYFPMGLSKAEAAFRAGRFLATNIITGGLARSIPNPARIGLITWLLGQLNEDQKPEVFQWYLRLNYGVFGLLGMDLSTQIGVQPFDLLPMPRSINWGDADTLSFFQASLEMLGVTGSDIALIIEVLKTQKPELLLSAMPMAYKVVQALEAEDGFLLSPYQRDRLIVKLSTKERVFLGLGFTPVKVSEQREHMKIESKRTSKHKSKKARYVDKILDAFEDGDKEKAGKLLKEASLEKPTPIFIEAQILINGIKARNIEAPVRQIMGMPKILRPEAIKRYQSIK